MGTEEVTAAVTPGDEPAPEPRKLEPWESVGMTKETWDALEIPEFLRRSDSIPLVSCADTKTVKIPPVAATGGDPNGSSTKQPAGLLDFEQFRVDPDEIETKIKAEADRRWRNWMPTKTERKRPRLSAYIKQVRKEFYP